MKSGVAGIDITPEPGPVLQGHWSTNPSHSVLYPLEVRAIVFEEGGTKTAIVTADVIGVTKETTDGIRACIEEATGIPGDHVMVACSHTHSAPASLGMGCLGIDPPEGWLERITDAATEAVTRTASSAVPVKFGLGCGSVHFNICRRPIPGSASMTLNFGGLVDRRVRVLVVSDENETPIGVLFHYSCHTTTKSGSEGDIHPDYAGIARRVIEEELGCKALFLAGCFGNIRPAILNPDTGGFKSASVPELDAVGAELGMEVCRVVRSLKAFESTALGANRRDVDIPFGETKPLDEIKELAADETSPRGIHMTGPWARRVLELMDKDEMPESRATEMQSMTVGPITCVTIPGEPAQEIGHAIEKSLRKIVDSDDVWPVGYANDEIGYLNTPRMYEEGGYEPNAYPYYGEPAGFKDEDTVIVETAEKLAKG